MKTTTISLKHNLDANEIASLLKKIQAEVSRKNLKEHAEIAFSYQRQQVRYGDYLVRICGADDLVVLFSNQVVEKIGNLSQKIQQKDSAYIYHANMMFPKRKSDLYGHSRETIQAVLEAMAIDAAFARS